MNKLKNLSNEELIKLLKELIQKEKRGNKTKKKEVIK